MRITVIGAGAVGGYFGGRMLEAGLDVTFLVREKRAQQLRETGLVLQSDWGNAELRQLKLAVRTADIPACDLVIVAVKNYQLAGAVTDIRDLAAKGAIVLPLLNGVEHFDILRSAVGAEHVMGGMCQVFATLNEAGEVVQTGQPRDLVFGPLSSGQAELGRNLAQACADCVGMRANNREDILTRVWQKYAFIAAFSGVTTAARLPIGQVLANPATSRVYRAALAEMAALAASQGVSLPGDFVDRMLESAHKLSPAATSSMHQDFLKELPLEVESLQGGALRLAEKSRFTLPTIATLYGLIKPYERI